MSATLLAAVFVASLLGSLHCVGMCGGFVAFYAGGAARPRPFGPHLAYHLGRLATYVALGAVAGALGRGVDLAGEAAGVGRSAAVAAGGLMTVWGLMALLRAAGVGIPQAALPEAARGRAVRWLSALAQRPPVTRAALLGLSSTLLPCGWLYAFAVIAAGTGTPLFGALLMAAFWAGSVPLLAGVGASFALLGERLRRHLPVASALLLIFIGLASLFGRLNVPSLAAASAASALGVGTPTPACHQGRVP